MGKHKLYKVKKYPGYYVIPCKPTHAISKCGKIINIITGRELVWTITPPFLVKNIKGGYRVNKIGSRHRLLALTFIPKPINPNNEKLIINHINGIPGDDRLENLEWVTYSQNTKHAYDLGLYPNKTVSVLVKDFIHDIIVKFGTVQMAADYTGLTHGSIWRRLKRQAGARYGDYAIKLDDGSEWPINFFRDTETNYPVAIKNVFNNTIYIFESTTDAARFAKCTQSGASKVILSQSNIPLNGFVFKPFSQDIEWPIFDEIDLQIIKETPRRPICGVLLKDTTDNVDLFFPSIEKSLEFLKVSVPALDKKIKRKNLIHDRYLATKRYISILNTYVPISSN